MALWPTSKTDAFLVSKPRKIFKICDDFSENAIFFLILKNNVSLEISTFRMFFSQVHHAVHIHTIIRLKFG